MRADAPPHLRVLVDRAGVVEEAHVALEAVPAVIGVGHPAAREHAREDLRPRRVQAGVHSFDEGRARRERKQLGQEVAQLIADCDRAIGTSDRHVHVEAEAVVAPDDVLEDLVVAAVVRRVDDPLVLPGAPGMRPGRAQCHSECVGQLLELHAALADPPGQLLEVVGAAGADLDLGGDQLADQVRLERRARGGGLQLLEAVAQRKRPGVEDRELLLDGDGEVGGALVLLAREVDLLLRAEVLRVTHGRTTLVEGLEQPSLQGLCSSLVRLGHDPGTVPLAWPLRSGGSRARAAGRRPGSTCGR